MKILGIDPGTATTGYGVIKVKKRGDKLACLDYGLSLIHISEPTRRS